MLGLNTLGHWLLRIYGAPALPASLHLVQAPEGRLAPEAAAPQLGPRRAPSSRHACPPGPAVPERSGPAPLPAGSSHGTPPLPCLNRTWDCHALPPPILKFFSPPHCTSTPAVSLLHTAFTIEPAASYLIPSSPSRALTLPPHSTCSQQPEGATTSCSSLV